MERLIEAVPNISEGRRGDVIDRLASTLSQSPGVVLLDRTSDADHNRTVFTYAGSPVDVRDASVRLVKEAARHIDLRRHRGAHPRMGAVDVLPFVPLEGVTLKDCAALAHQAGEAIWTECQVPVYFYEAAARDESRRRLEVVRKGGFEAPALPPDLGSAIHPTAGATIVGARPFLIAYNVNLASADVDAAKAIARAIRTSSGGLPCLKALGLALPSRGVAQVSMNLTDFQVTSVDDAFTAVAQQAERRGIGVLGSELIGLIPRRAVPRIDVRWENFDDSMILENRLAALRSSPPPRKGGG